MNKALFSIVSLMLVCATIIIGMRYPATPEMREHENSLQEKRNMTEQWLKAVADGNYTEAENGIKRGIDPQAVNNTYALHNLKRNGYYAKKRGEADNKYYMTLRVLKKNGVDIGMPYVEFGDPVLDAEYQLP